MYRREGGRGLRLDRTVVGKQRPWLLPKCLELCNNIWVTLALYSKALSAPLELYVENIVHCNVTLCNIVPFCQSSLQCIIVSRQICNIFEAMWTRWIKAPNFYKMILTP